jgi:hypothetical protein
MMEMLEGRATVREEMGCLAEALRDGNRMLKIERSNPKVFIRVRTPLIGGVYLYWTFARDEKEI